MTPEQKARAGDAASQVLRSAIVRLGEEAEAAILAYWCEDDDNLAAELDCTMVARDTLWHAFGAYAGEGTAPAAALRAAAKNAIHDGDEPLAARLSAIADELAAALARPRADTVPDTDRAPATPPADDCAACANPAKGVD